MDKKERTERLLEISMKTRGNARWEYLIRTDPDAFEAYQAVYEKGLMQGKHLPIKRVLRIRL